jgi:hypothetical protein
MSLLFCLPSPVVLMFDLLWNRMIMQSLVTASIAIACFAIGWGIRPFADPDLAATVLSSLNSSLTKSSNSSINSTMCTPTNATLGYSYTGIAAHNLPLVGRYNNTRVRRKKRMLTMNSTLPFVLVADLDSMSNRK